MPTAANTRITESGVVAGAVNAGRTRITESGVIVGARNAGDVRITESGVIAGARNVGDARITLSGLIIGVLQCPKPDSPTGVSLSSKGEKVTISWPDPGIAGGTVNVYRGTSPGAEALVASGIGSSLTTYTDTVPTPGIPYYYEIDFVNTCGEGRRSAEVSITPQCCGGVVTPSTAPSTTFTASACPTTTYTASACPTSTATPSTCPSTVYTASQPPSPTNIVPSGCPE